ncbi:hypothetical protein OJJOAM_001675 [Cupriavidus sp. H18C1]
MTTSYLPLSNRRMAVLSVSAQSTVSTKENAFKYSSNMLRRTAESSISKTRSVR